MLTKSTCIFEKCLPVLLCLISPIMAISMQEYFPQIGSDLTTVTWAHAVNSKQQLYDAFEANVMMLEADVVLGTLIGGFGEVIPVMAHPPETTSDMSLSEFLSTVVGAVKSGQRCGIKLDFKTIQVVSPSVEELQLYRKMINFPVMLNADILPGPVNSTATPVDADAFLKLCSKHFPNSTLSVGWTTQYGGLIFDGSYSQEQVEAMEDALKRNNISQPVTFPVRAGITAKSADTLTWLKNSVYNSTFTIWSSESDPVDVELLRGVILDTLGRHRVFVDVPNSLWDKLQLSASKAAGQTSASSSSSSSIKTVFVAMVTALLYSFK